MAAQPTQPQINDALWIFKIYADDSKTDDEPMVKKYVKQATYGYGHYFYKQQEIISSLLDSVDWNKDRRYEIGKSEMSITYYNERYKESVDVFLQDAVIPGTKYYVTLGSAPSGSWANGSSTSGKSATLNGPD